MHEAALYNVMAAYYDLYRPDYPAAAVEAVCRRGGLAGTSRVLEVGAGSGKATRQFLAQGLSLTCIEPGIDLAAQGNAQYGRQGAQFIAEKFEDFNGESGAYDAIFSAQAFHWVAQPDGYRQCLRLLRPGGTLALLWNLDLFEETVADRALWQLLEECCGFVSCVRRCDYPARQSRIHHEMANLFAPPEVMHFTQKIRYSPEAYHRYLLTGHVFVQQETAVRSACLDALHRLADRYPDVLLRHYTCEVYLAKKPRPGAAQ